MTQPLHFEYITYYFFSSCASNVGLVPLCLLIVLPYKWSHIEEVGIPNTLEAFLKLMPLSVITFNAFSELSSLQALVFRVFMNLLLFCPFVDVRAVGALWLLPSLFEPLMTIGAALSDALQFVYMRASTPSLERHRHSY